MKNTSFLVLLIFSVMLIILASALFKPVVAENPVIVGKWDRTDGSDKYTIYADGVTQTVLPDGTHHGTWEYDGSSGYKYIFRWDFGPSGRESFVDYVTVAADGQSYSGYNNYGDHFNCVRVSSETGPAPGVDSGFPLVYVAVGGGIAAIASVGVAVYYFFVAGGSAGAGTVTGTSGGISGANSVIGTGSVSGVETPEGLLPMEPISSELFENFVSNLVSDTVSDVVNSIGCISTSAGTSAGTSTSIISPSSSGNSVSALIENINDIISSGVVNACNPDEHFAPSADLGSCPGLGGPGKPIVDVSL